MCFHTIFLRSHFVDPGYTSINHECFLARLATVHLEQIAAVRLSTDEQLGFVIIDFVDKQNKASG